MIFEINQFSLEYLEYFPTQCPNTTELNELKVGYFFDLSKKCRNTNMNSMNSDFCAFLSKVSEKCSDILDVLLISLQNIEQF